MKENKLTYIVLSDLHLGEVESLFTPASGQQASLLLRFSECLADLVASFEQEELPTLVLNGDILGLSFSSYHESLTVFEQFLQCFTRNHQVCEKMAYLPGNHDQHIWKLAVEERFQQALRARSDGAPIPVLQHSSSPLYAEGFSSSFFSAFFAEDQDVGLKMLYPNMLIPPPSSGGNAILIHHGHFAEATYHSVSNAMQALYPDLARPANLEALAHENDSMINFLFSDLGRSGAAGVRFEQLMETLSSKELLKEHIDELAENLAKAVDYPYIPFHFLEKILSRTLIENIANNIRSERYNAGEVCSEKTMKGLLKYLREYCLELLQEYNCSPENLTFIWSHTHKPFAKEISAPHFPDLKVFNTGGWVLPHEAIPVMGASVMLIDQHNQVHALRIFNDADNGGQMQFQLMPEAAADDAFANAINTYLYSAENQLHPLWNSFREELQQEIKKRRQHEV